MRTTIKFTDRNHMAVTGGTNGYPEPELGVAIFSDDSETLVKLAKENDLELHTFHWLAGWTFCEDKGMLHDISDTKEYIDGDDPEGAEFINTPADRYNFENHNWRAGIYVPKEEWLIKHEYHVALKKAGPFLAKELRTREKKMFSEEFYSDWNIKTGEVPDDQESPIPWGCPWLHGSPIELNGDNIEEMVACYIEEHQAEWQAAAKEEKLHS